MAIEYQSLVKLFIQNGSEQSKKFNCKIYNSGVEVIGCAVPFVRSVAKKYLTQLNEVMELPTNEFVEIDMFKGMVVVASKLPFVQKQAYLTKFAYTIENWAVCDVNCVKFPLAEKQLYFDYFCDLALSNKTFVCRYGLVNLLTSFLDNDCIDRIFKIVSQISNRDYYVDMAIAWLVATAMVKCRDKTVKFMCGSAKEQLSVFAYNAALQKMRDSKLVSQQDKQWTKTLKR